MGRPKIDRTGEIGYNNFGSKMIITRSNGNADIDVYFPEYNWTYKKQKYWNFMKGIIKCPYERNIFGKGYIGDGKYKSSENNNHTIYYEIWHSMIERCYDTKEHKKHPTYKECEVDEYFLNFQNMGEWLDEHYYEVPDEMMCLDKDIKFHGNKLYSKDTCLIVPERINKLFLRRQNHRGKDPLGVRQVKSGKFVARCHDKNCKRITLGTYLTREKAFEVYKEFKEKVIKEVADEYYSKGLIPKEVYDALYNYEVLITD